MQISCANFKKGRTDASMSAMRSWKASGSSSNSTARRCEQYACSTCMRNEACWCMKLCRVPLAASSAGDRGGPWAFTTCPSTAYMTSCLRGANTSTRYTAVSLCHWYVGFGRPPALNAAKLSILVVEQRDGPVVIMDA